MRSDTLHIGLVGDRNDAVTAHRAIPLALRRAADEICVAVEMVWLPTETIVDTEALAAFDALWCVPASPYRSFDGALTAIRFARERAAPFLGTCGGFQHAVVEYARHVLGWADAEHAETAPESARPVISALACALVETRGAVHLEPGSRIAGAYGRASIQEGYHCRYGLNPSFEAALTRGPLRASARDDVGGVRAVELDTHTFFVATLFQPERTALDGVTPPLVRAFVAACRARLNHGDRR